MGAVSRTSDGPVVQLPITSGSPGEMLDSLAWWLSYHGATVIRQSTVGKQYVMEAAIDGDPLLLDMSDYPAVQYLGARPYWKKVWITAHSHMPQVRPIPPLTKQMWSLYHERKSFQWRRGDKIVVAFQIPSSDYVVAQRRIAVMDVLAKEYSGRIETVVSQGRGLWQAAQECLCVVHVGGSYAGILDHVSIECLSMGVPLITDLIYSRPAGMQLHPYEHYIPACGGPEGFASAVDYCLSNLSKLGDIGRNGSMWYDQAVGPVAYERLLSQDVLLW